MKATIIAIIGAALLLSGAIILAGRDPSRAAAPSAPGDNVSLVDGKQIVEVSAKGGYYPRKSVAQAGIPTILRFKTRGTYDCSSAVRIPSMGRSLFLPPSGTTDVDLGNPQVGSFFVTCGMGMYSFEIDFRS